jgi:hypothetical protein
MEKGTVLVLYRGLINIGLYVTICVGMPLQACLIARNIAAVLGCTRYIAISRSSGLCAVLLTFEPENMQVTLHLTFG